MSKKIALWNPYLDTVGGGEKHALQICEYFVKNGYELTIFWDESIKKPLEEKLAIQLPKDTRWLKKLTSYSAVERLSLLRIYDVLVYVTDGSYFVSTAKKTVCFCMVPERKLYKMNLKNQIRTLGWKWLCNSQFTKQYLENWGVHANVVYPIVTVEPVKKRSNNPGTSLTFLTVGRFFSHLHSKRHDAAVAWFVNFITQNPSFATSKLVLVGGLKKEDQRYFDSLKKLSFNHPNVLFKTNVSSQDLEHWYNRADYYLHFAGWQVNESVHPERTEHLGITPLEAMSCGCIPFCYKSGGIREVVHDGENGFTFKSLNELSEKVMKINRDTKAQENLRTNGRKTVENTFSSESLDASMNDIFHLT
ncbi:glycosyltransferase family 4 protein [Candidatus Woesebacteria bacterium]|nr:glycosyltransferase family 4 protein [Candidatus Woesebacteria bacterium]